MTTKNCPTCGRPYKSFGGHWRWNPECRPELTDREHSILTGCMLGDGYADPAFENAYVGVVNTNERFLSWLDDELYRLTTPGGIRVAATPEESAQHVRDGLGKEPVDVSAYKTVRELRTAGHPAMEEFVEWYDSGSRQPPEEVELTPTTAKVWFACDGSCSWHESYAHGFASFSVTGLDDGSAETLVQAFQEAGFDGNHTAGRIQFSVEETRRLLKWMGDPIPGFAYKWEADDHGHYRRLRQMRGVLHEGHSSFVSGSQL